MALSMTGYGRWEDKTDIFNVSVEIKSVNHRYLEIATKTPKAYGFIDDKIKTIIKNRVSRGKLDVNVYVDSTYNDSIEILVNEDIVEKYVLALRGVQEKYALTDDLSLSSVSTFQDVFTVKQKDVDEEKLIAIVESATEKALSSFISMREIEGEHLKKDVQCRIEKLLKYTEDIDNKFPQILEQYKEKLQEKFQVFLSNNTVSQDRILLEVGIFSEKIAVDEETVRLKSHFKQIESMLSENIPIGRKMDFITQEINREVNTIGSKISDSEMLKIVIDMKSEIEKVREQIQNIE